MGSEGERKRWPRWPGWAMLLLAAGAYLFMVKMQYPVPRAEYMGTQLMRPGATVTFEIPTGIETVAGAHVVRDPKAVIQVVGDDGWTPAALQPTIVDTSGEQSEGSGESAKGAGKSEVIARLRIALPDDQSLRGMEARLSIPLHIEYRVETEPKPKTWKRTYNRKFEYATTELENKVVTWDQRRGWLRWGAIALFFAGCLFWIVRRIVNAGVPDAEPEIPQVPQW